jgi:cytochrome c-type biogenesis protein CcmH
MTLQRLFSALALALVCATASLRPAYAIDPLPFENQKQEQRFQAVTAELRCLQCQNQNLADSDAGLAKDMRLQIFEMMQKGDSDQQIKQYMIDRYGDFVIYSPPFNWQNSLLWLLPLLAALSGIAFVVWHFRGARLSGAALSKTGDTVRPNTEPGTKAPQVDAGDNW